MPRYTARAITMRVDVEEFRMGAGGTRENSGWCSRRSRAGPIRNPRQLTVDIGQRADTQPAPSTRAKCAISSGSIVGPAAFVQAQATESSSCSRTARSRIHDAHGDSLSATRGRLPSVVPWTIIACGIVAGSCQGPRHFSLNRRCCVSHSDFSGQVAGHAPAVYDAAMRVFRVQSHPACCATAGPVHVLPASAFRCCAVYGQNEEGYNAPWDLIGWWASLRRVRPGVTG